MNWSLPENSKLLSASSQYLHLLSQYRFIFILIIRLATKNIWNHQNLPLTLFFTPYDSYHWFLPVSTRSAHFFPTKFDSSFWTLRFLLKIEFLEFSLRGFCVDIEVTFFCSIIVEIFFSYFLKIRWGHWRRSGIELRGLRKVVASLEFLQRVFLSLVEIFRFVLYKIGLWFHFSTKYIYK